MHALLFTGTANEMQAWMTAIDSAIQGSASKAKERVKKVQLRFEHKKVGITTLYIHFHMLYTLISLLLGHECMQLC